MTNPLKPLSQSEKLNTWLAFTDSFKESGNIEALINFAHYYYSLIESGNASRDLRSKFSYLTSLIAGMLSWVDVDSLDVTAKLLLDDLQQVPKYIPA